MLTVAPKKCIMDIMDEIYFCDNAYNYYHYQKDDIILMQQDEVLEKIATSEERGVTACILEKRYLKPIDLNWSISESSIS